MRRSWYGLTELKYKIHKTPFKSLCDFSSWQYWSFNASVRPRLFTKRLGRKGKVCFKTAAKSESVFSHGDMAREGILWVAVSEQKARVICVCWGHCTSISTLGEQSCGEHWLWRFRGHSSGWAVLFLCLLHSKQNNKVSGEEKKFLKCLGFFQSLLQQGHFAEVVLSIEFLPNGSFLESKKIKYFQ